MIRRRTGAERETAIELLAGALTELEEFGTSIGELAAELESAESQRLQARLTSLQTNASGMLYELAGVTGH